MDDLCDNRANNSSFFLGGEVQTQVNVDKVEVVPLKKYEDLLRLLEDERIAHAQTKARLMEAEDRLAFSMGEVEVLKKQIEREKSQFEKTFGIVKTKALRESCRNVELENQCEVISHQVAQRTSHLKQTEAEVEALSQKLQEQQREYMCQLQELDIQRQQEAYIARVLEGDNRVLKKPDGTVSGKRDIIGKSAITPGFEKQSSSKSKMSLQTKSCTAAEKTVHHGTKNKNMQGKENKDKSARPLSATVASVSSASSGRQLKSAWPSSSTVASMSSASAGGQTKSTKYQGNRDMNDAEHLIKEIRRQIDSVKNRTKNNKK